MAAPVLVRAYRSDPALPLNRPVTPRGSAQTLPPVSAYTFAAILRASDGPEFQQAIDGIAEICAKNRMSLADEYSSHLPPLGEITAANSGATRSHLLLPGGAAAGGGMRRALTSVPEGSSGSSEGSSRKSKKVKPKVGAGGGGGGGGGGLFSFRRREAQGQPMRQMMIGSMGRSIDVRGTTAMGSSFGFGEELEGGRVRDAAPPVQARMQERPRRDCEATESLQRLLSRAQNGEAT